MATNLTYLKGIRTWYRNFLEKEVEIGNGILRSDLTEINADEAIVTIEKCIEKIEHFSEKVEVQMEKINKCS